VLSEYRVKRRPDRSGEPAEAHAPRNGPGDPETRFVIQRHAASGLHFDFRLEIDGVLVSWAVPKGPSTDSAEKRLATRTEDHPLAYLDFEGRIPAGQYGHGTVVVWDTGTFANLSDEDLVSGLHRGHLKFWLDGERLSGAYALTQIRTRGGDQNWLLVKVDDETVDPHSDLAHTGLESVLTGRTRRNL